MQLALERRWLLLYVMSCWAWLKTTSKKGNSLIFKHKATHRSNKSHRYYKSHKSYILDHMRLENGGHMESLGRGGNGLHAGGCSSPPKDGEGGAWERGSRDRPIAEPLFGVPFYPILGPRDGMGCVATLPTCGPPRTQGLCSLTWN